jgi:drug/metabolite transporter (DMT)-like permease
MCAYTIYAQSFGHRHVSPTDANLIYTEQPIITVLFAWELLGETLGLTGFVIIALISSAFYTMAMMKK